MKRILCMLLVAVLITVLFVPIALAAAPPYSEQEVFAVDDEPAAIVAVDESDDAVTPEVVTVDTNAINVPTIIIVIAIVVVVFGGLGFLIPYLVKKGVNLSGMLNTTTTALNTADKVMDGLTEYFPEVPAFALIDKVIGWAKKGAEAAEQLYNTSKISAENRKEEATKLVYEYIAAAGIELDDNMRKVVEGSIEAAVFALPQTHTDSNTERYGEIT